MREKKENNNKNKKQTAARLSLLWEFMGEYRSAYIAAVAAVAIATLAGYVAPLVLRFTIDSVIGSEPIERPAFLARLVAGAGFRESIRTRLWVPALVIVGVTALGGVFQFIQKRWAAVASEKTAERIRERLYDHLQHLSYDYHVKAETGDLIQRCTSDVDTVRKFLSVQMVEVGRALILLGTAYPLLFALHVKLALLSVPIVVLIFVFSLVFFKRVQRAFKKVDESEGRMSTVLQENLTGVRVVRAFARQKHEEDKFAERNTEFRGLVVKLINQRSWIRHAVLMFQKELAERLCASPGSKTYGRLSVMLQYCAHVQLVRLVRADQFFPKPKVDSAIVRMDFKENIEPAVNDEKLFTRVVQAAFGQRRKTLRNALAGNLLSIDTTRAAEILEKVNIDPRRRAETLSVEEFVALSNCLLSGMARSS